MHSISHTATINPHKTKNLLAKMKSTTALHQMDQACCQSMCVDGLDTDGFHPGLCGAALHREGAEDLVDRRCNHKAPSLRQLWGLQWRYADFYLNEYRWWWYHHDDSLTINIYKTTPTDCITLKQLPQATVERPWSTFHRGFMEYLKSISMPSQLRVGH